MRKLPTKELSSIPRVRFSNQIYAGPPRVPPKVLGTTDNPLADNNHPALFLYPTLRLAW